MVSPTITRQARVIGLARSPLVLLLGLLAGVGLLALALIASIAFGAADIAPIDVWSALVAYDSTSTQHLIIWTLRLPRAAAAAMVGAVLAVAGALMQGLTRWHPGQ